LKTHAFPSFRRDRKGGEIWTYPLLKKSWRVVKEREMAVAVVDVDDVG
jgi:hypothetical protein